MEKTKYTTTTDSHDHELLPFAPPEQSRVQTQIDEKELAKELAKIFFSTTKSKKI